MIAWWYQEDMIDGDQEDMLDGDQDDINNVAGHGHLSRRPPTLQSD